MNPPSHACFEGFDLAGFQEESDYALTEYVEPLPAPETIATVEAELGCRLPARYVALMQSRNGGIPARCRFPTDRPTSWAGDHVAISASKGIGFAKPWSPCGGLGSRFRIEAREYPDIGVYVGDCPCAGHDGVSTLHASAHAGGGPVETARRRRPPQASLDAIDVLRALDGEARTVSR